MGFYINPPDMEKEKFLDKFGVIVPEGNVIEYVNNTPDQQYLISPRRLVCLVNNGPFTAAGIAYELEEAKRFLKSFQIGDKRLHIWYIVAKEDLTPYLPKLEPQAQE